MAEVIANIKFVVDGVDQFKNVFKAPVNDLDTIVSKYKQIAKAPIGKSIAGVTKITPEMKKAASYAWKYVQALKEAKNLTGKQGAQYFSEVSANLQTGVSGLKVAGKSQKVRKISDFGGQSQLQFAEKMRMSIVKAQQETLRKLQSAMRSLPANVNTSELYKKTRDALNQAITKSSQKIKSSLESGTLTAETGNKIKSALQVSIDKIVADMKAKAGAIKTSETGFKSVARTVKDLREKINIELKKAVWEFESNEVSGNVKNIAEKFNAWARKQMEEVEKLRESGKLTKDMADKRIDAIKRSYSYTVSAIKKRISVEKKANQKVLRETENKQKEQLRFEKNVARAKRKLMYKIEDVISKRVNSLKIMKFNTNPLKRAGIDKYIEKHKMFLGALTQELEKQMPKTKEELEKFTRSITKKLSSGVDNLKAEQEASGGSRLGAFLFNRATVQSAAAFAGTFIHALGSQLEKGLESTRLRGRLASGMTDVFMSAFMVTKFAVFREILNIGFQTVDMFIDTLAEIPRMLGNMLAGVFKGIGRALQSGIGTTLLLASGMVVSGLSAIVTGGIGLVVGLLVGGAVAIETVIKGLGNFISSFVKSIVSMVMSILKLAVMTISATIKGLMKVIQSLFKSLFEGLKKATEEFVKFMAKAFNGLVQLVKMSMKEFAGATEYATRAFKETVGVAGQSVQQFQQLISEVRAGFGFSQEDVGEAIFDVVSSGFRDVAKAKEISAQASILAIAAESDLKTSTNALITALQNFNVQGETAESIMKTLASATTLGRMTMSELGNAMKSVMGLAARANLTFKDTMLSLSALTRTFGRGSIEQGTRFFNRFLEAISMPRSRSAKELEKMGISMVGMGKNARFLDNIVGLVMKMEHLDLRDVRKVFTTIQSRRAWLALTKDIKQLKGMFSDFDVVSQNVGYQFEQMFETPARVFKRIQESFRTMMVSLGGAVWDVLKESVMDVTKVLFDFVRLLNSTQGRKFFQEFAKWVLPIADTVFKPLTVALREFYQFLNRGRGLGNDFSKIFKTEFAENLQRGIIHVINNIKKLITFIYQIATASEAVKKVWEKIEGVFQKVSDYLTSNTWSEWLADIINGLAKIKGMIKDVFTAEGSDFDWVQDVIDEILFVVRELVSTIGKIISKMMLPIVDRLMALIGVRIKNSLIDAFRDALSFLVSKLGKVEYFTGVVGEIKNVLDTWEEGLSNISNVNFDMVNSKSFSPGDYAKEIAKGMDTGNLTALLTEKKGSLRTPLGIVFDMVKSMRSEYLNSKGVRFERAGRFSGIDERSKGLQDRILRQNISNMQRIANTIPHGTKMRGDSGDTYDVGKHVRNLSIAVKQLQSGGTVSDDMRKSLDVAFTELNNFSRSGFAESIGYGGVMKEMGFAELVDFSNYMIKTFRDRIEAEKFTNTGISDALPEVENDLKRFGSIIVDSARNIKTNLKERFKLGKTVISSSEIQDILKSRDASRPISLEAQKRERKVRSFKSDYDASEGKRARAEEALGSVAKKRMRYDVEDAYSKLMGNPEVYRMSKANVKSGVDVEGGRYKVGADVKSRDMGAMRMVVAEMNKALSQDEHSKRLVELTQQTNKLLQELNKAKDGRTYDEITKEAKSERTHNYRESLKNMTDEDLVKEYQRVRKERTKYEKSSIVKGADGTRKVKFDNKLRGEEGYRKYMDEYKKELVAWMENLGVDLSVMPADSLSELESKKRGIQKDRVDAEKLLMTSSMFTDGQGLDGSTYGEKIAKYHNKLKQPTFDEFSQGKYTDTERKSRRREMLGRALPARGLRQREGLIKEEAEFRKEKRRVDATTAKNVQGASTKDEATGYVLKGEQKKDQMDLDKIQSEKALLEKKIADKQALGKDARADKARLEELTKEEEAIEKGMAKRKGEIKKQDEKIEQRKVQNEANKAVIAIKDKLSLLEGIKSTNDDQLKMLTTNTKGVFNIGGLLQMTIGKDLKSGKQGFKVSKEEVANVGEVY